MPTHDEIFQKVQSTLVDALGVDDDDVTPHATLRSDLGAESIDFLDIVFRLEKAFELLGAKAQAKKCEAMEGILKEGDSIVEDTKDGTATRDVGLIMAAQKVEHYEIATYGSLVQLAKDMGENEVATLLQETLKEEKAADQKLTQLAQSGINKAAAQEMEA